MFYLGLDISTSHVGWCVLNEDTQLVKMGNVRLVKEKKLYCKTEMVKDALCNLKSHYDIQSVFIEENLQAFRPGFSSAKTLLTLARFNGTISYVCEQVFGFEPNFINVNVARKIVGLKIVRKSKGGAPTKHQVWDWVNRQIEHHWSYKTLKSGPRKGLKVLEDGCYDMADSYVIAKAGVMLHSEQIKKSG